MIEKYKKITNFIKKINNKNLLNFDEKYDYSYILKNMYKRSFKKIITHQIFSSWIEIENILKKVENLSRGITKEKMILLYGDEIGVYKWDSYRQKQSIKNTFEYKSKKYGITEEEFKNFNLRRAITKENLIKKYGETSGIEKWNSYCEKQRYTNTKDYLKERYDLVNFKKSHTIDSYILKYKNYEIAKEKLENYWSKFKGRCYSKDSQNLFWKLYFTLTDEEKDSCYFAEKNKEFCIYDKTKNKVFLYDFVCTKLKICIEYNGDHYHGNPKTYKPEDFLRGRGCTKIKAKDIWEKDEYKKNLLKEQRNIEVFTVWEYSIKNDFDNTYKKILEIINEKRSIF